MFSLHSRGSVRRLLASAGLIALVCGVAPAQINNSVLQYVQTIIVPTWTNTGTNQQNSDIWAF